MVRRSRLEIYFDVLKVIDSGVHKPTRVMYKTNLSWDALQRSFDTLIDGGFIRVKSVEEKKRYHITERGRSALSYHERSLEGLLEAIPR